MATKTVVIGGYSIIVTATRRASTAIFDINAQTTDLNGEKIAINAIVDLSSYADPTLALITLRAQAVALAQQVARGAGMIDGTSPLTL